MPKIQGKAIVALREFPGQIPAKAGRGAIVFQGCKINIYPFRKLHRRLNRLYKGWDKNAFGILC
jgi:hypothetical protein